MLFKSRLIVVLSLVVFSLIVIAAWGESLLLSAPAQETAVSQVVAQQVLASGQAKLTVRIATFNCSMNRNSEGQLLEDLRDDSSDQILKVARILRTVRPEIVLLNEFDYDPSGEAVRLFHDKFLNANRSEITAAPIEYPYSFTGPVNTGVPSGRDLDHDGQTDGPADAIGFGRFPGQYGMVVYSRYPINADAVRTFQKLLWKDMPQAGLPVDPDNKMPWYSSDDLNVLALSSKSHWDVPVTIAQKTIHLLVSHPTPPAFDGPEDSNGRRNHDEIRLWAEYISNPAVPWLKDDQGKSGPLNPLVSFVILGDQNADPNDGDSYLGAIDQLLTHPRINSSRIPTSDGAVLASDKQQGANLRHKGPAAHDTADFSDRVVGNLRVDYVLPSSDLNVVKTAVFWPGQGQPGADDIDCTDHRLVWIDIELP